MTLALKVCETKCASYQKCALYPITTSPGWPRLPRDISIEFDGTTATISWLVPFIASTPETYNIRYGYSSDSLDFPTDRILSGNDTSIINQHYSIAIEELFFVTTYYFRITVMNEVGAANSDILPFTTGEGGRAHTLTCSVIYDTLTVRFSS